jgi:ankyrin repeat protein
MSEPSEVIKAIHTNDLPAFERTLREHPELVDAKDDKGSSALLLSAYYGRPEMTALLLSLGARVGFFEACAVGLSAEVERTLGQSPDSVRQRSHDGWTALHLAAFFGHLEVVTLLLDGGSDPLAISHNHEANLALNAAAAAGRNDVVRLLIERGCPVDARGSGTGYTALHLAAHAGRAALVQFLLDAGADRSLTIATGETALDLARKSKHDAVVDLFRAP